MPAFKAQQQMFTEKALVGGESRKQVSSIYTQAERSYVKREGVLFSSLLSFSAVE